MGLEQDLPLLAGLLILLGGLVVGVGQVNLPGTGNIEIPSDTTGDKNVNYDMSGQYTVSASALGEVEVDGFTYQTKKSCDLCLSIGNLSSLSLTGASDVRSTVTVTRQSNGNTVMDTTYKLGEVRGGGEQTVKFKVNNLQPGTYDVKTRTVWNPEWFDLTNDGEIVKTWTISVPKVSS